MPLIYRLITYSCIELQGDSVKNKGIRLLLDNAPY